MALELSVLSASLAPLQRGLCAIFETMADDSPQVGINQSRLACYARIFL